MGQEDLLRGIGNGQARQPFLNVHTQQNVSEQQTSRNVNASTNETGVELTISNPSPEELNKGIVQAVQDYSLAKMRNDQKGMAIAVQTVSNLRALEASAPVPFEESLPLPPRMFAEGANGETAWADKRTGSVVITSGPDAGTVVVAPARPDVAALNMRAENAKVKYFRAQILGDTKTMAEAAKEGQLARDLGATLRADQDTPLTTALKRYVNKVDVIKTALSSRTTLDLNKGIVQLKNDYQYAKNTNDPVGMEAARVMGDILRRLGGTIGAEVSLEDARKMVQPKPTLPSPLPPPLPSPPYAPVDTSPKNAEVFDRVLGFVTGAGVATGKSLLSVIQANADPLGTAISAIHNFVTSLPDVYHAAVDWENTVSQIDNLLTDLRNYYESAPPFEKGKLEGEVLVQAVTLIFANKKVWIKNGKLATSVHPVTGVPFDVQGFPIFDAKFETRISSEFYTAGTTKHRKLANEQLKKAIEENLELGTNSTQKQLNDIRNGRTPTGLVWHHHQETGLMQLVDGKIHADTGHTGGIAIWGRE